MLETLITYSTAGGNAVFVAGGIFLVIAAAAQLYRRIRDGDLTWYGLEFLAGVLVAALAGFVVRIGQWFLAQIVAHPIGPKGPGSGYALWIWDTRGLTTLLAAFVFVFGVSLCLHAATRRGSLTSWLAASPVFAAGFWLLGAYLNAWAEAV